MKTLQEQIAVMQHFDNGGQVEYLDDELDDNWYHCDNPSWNWDECQFRIAQPPKQKMWQWIMQTDNTVWITYKFYPNKDAVQQNFTQIPVIKPALWTEIEV